MTRALRRCAALTAFLVGWSSAAVPLVSAADNGGWTRPVPGPVVRPFIPPRTRYGPGHLGADLAAIPGSPVRAAGEGTVEFAGSVAGVRYVVVRHAGGVRTSYGFLRSVAVRRGQVVGQGAVVGTAGGTGENHDGRVVYIGLRMGGTYVDPMQLFAPVDLSERVRLAPVVADASGP